MNRFLTWLMLGPDYRIIRVESWRLSRARNVGVYGPCVLVDTPFGHRQTIWPIWDRHRLRWMFGLNDREAERLFR